MAHQLGLAYPSGVIIRIMWYPCNVFYTRHGQEKKTLSKLHGLCSARLCALSDVRRQQRQSRAEAFAEFFLAKVSRVSAFMRANFIRVRWTLAVKASQRSLHNAPIFRLLLKVAVIGTQQCESPNFCGDQFPNMPCEKNVGHSHV
jgi:hypothetical protein